MILVTGATGFIGRHVVSALAASGVPICAAVRDRSRAPLLPQGTTLVVTGDLRDQVDWAPLLAGIAGVIHLAGHAHITRVRPADVDVYHRVNARATRQLAEAAAVAGVRRLIFLSSSHAIGDHSPEAVSWREETPCAPQDAYGRSKLEAERALGHVARRSSLETVILRPPVVYGPGVTANIYHLFRLIDRGVPLPVSRINNQRSLLYVGNLVDAIVRVLHAPAAAGELYHVTDGEDVSTPQLVQRIAFSLSRPVRLFPAPAWTLRVAGRFGDVLEHAGLAFPVNTPNVNRLVMSLALDATKIRRALGWTPQWSLDAGLVQTARWYGETRPGSD